MITRLHPNTLGMLDADQAALPHVLLVVDQFPKTLGGGERVVLKLASLLPSYGFRVSILTFAVYSESALFESLPCPVYVLPLRRTYDVGALRAAFIFRRFLVEQQIKIVQTFFESSDIWAGFVTKMMSNAKLIWSRRDMGILRSGKHRVAYRLMGSIPDAVFAVSEQVRQYCIEVDRIEASRVQTIYNGVDLVHPGVVSNTVRPKDEPHITTVGNIRRVKGHDIFIRAAGFVASRFPGATFSIAGEVLEPSYFEELKSLVESLGLNEKFFFVGGAADLNEHLSEADVFVLPSRSEGFSNALIEAMAASLPVIATDVGGNAEAVQNGVTGFIIPPEDPAALSKAIVQLLSDRQRATDMGAAGSIVVSQSFTSEVMMNRITTTYSSLLKR